MLASSPELEFPVQGESLLLTSRNVLHCTETDTVQSRPDGHMLIDCEGDVGLGVGLRCNRFGRIDEIRGHSRRTVDRGGQTEDDILHRFHLVLESSQLGRQKVNARR